MRGEDGLPAGLAATGVKVEAVQPLLLRASTLRVEEF